MTIFFRFFTITVLCISTLFAQNNESRDLLQRVSETYKNASQFRFEGEAVRLMSAKLRNDIQKYSLTLAGTSSGKLLYLSDDSITPAHIIFDGTTLWRVFPASRQYIQGNIQGDLRKIADGGQENRMAINRAHFEKERYFRLTENLLSSHLLPEETLDFDGQEVPCFVVHATYQPRSVSSSPITIHRTFWIDKKTHLIRRDEFVQRGALFPNAPFDEVDSRSILKYHVASINEPPDDSLFHYDPPSHFSRVTEFVPYYKANANKLIGKPATDFSAKTLEGTPLKLSDFKGKTVFLDFWASWCEPCRQQTPFLIKLYQQAKNQGMVFIGINRDESVAKASEYVKQQQLPWTNVFDGEKNAIHAQFQATGIPALMVIDPEGKVVEYVIGNGKEVETKILNALKKLDFKFQEF